MDARLGKAMEQLLHALLGAGDDGHFHHHVVEVLRGHGHVGQHQLLTIGGVVLFHAEADLLQARVSQTSGGFGGQQVAAGIHALVSVGEQLARPLQQAQGALQGKQGLAAGHGKGGQFAAAALVHGLQLLFPRTAVFEKVLVVGQVVVEAEVAVPMAAQGGAEGFAALVARALHARRGKPAGHDAGAGVAKRCPPAGKLFPQLSAAGIR